MGLKLSNIEWGIGSGVHTPHLCAQFRTRRSVRSQCYTSIPNHMFGIQPGIANAESRLLTIVQSLSKLESWFLFLCLNSAQIAKQLYQIWMVRHFLRLGFLPSYRRNMHQKALARLSHQVIALGTSQKIQTGLPIYLRLGKVVYRINLKRLLIPLSEIRFTGAR